MSTPTPARDTDRARTTAVPRPRPPVEPPVEGAAAPQREQTAADETAGRFGRHPWLVPATAIACVVAVFLAMVLLTWAAGGGTPFD